MMKRLERPFDGWHAAPAPVSRRRAAFSLIELLVVVGLIGILVGALALSLGGRGGEGAALTNAQSIVSGMVGSARAQAALQQRKTRVIVYAQMPPAPNADAAKYLRAIQIVREEISPTGTSDWVAAGDFVILPAPICVVPPAPVPTNHLRLPTGQNWNNNAATGPVSTLVVQTGFSYRGQVGSTGRQFFGVTGQAGRILYLEFESDGTVSSNPTTNPTKIALGTAILASGALPLFNNANGVRGVVVRKSGAVSLVDGATAF